MSTDDEQTTPAPAERAATDDTMVAALLRERAGYVQLGFDDRVALVDEQLALRGHTAPAGEPKDAKPAAKRQQQTRA